MHTQACAAVTVTAQPAARDHQGHEHSHAESGLLCDLVIAALLAPGDMHCLDVVFTDHTGAGCYITLLWADPESTVP